MKAKLIILAIAAIALLSFTFSANTKAPKVTTAEAQKSGTESSGLAMEDRDQWK